MATLPLISLRNIVVFPGNIIPLYVGRKNSLSALEAASASPAKEILLVSQTDPNLEDPTIKDLQSVGTLAKIIQLLRLPNGTVKVLVEGEKRVALKFDPKTEPYFQAEYTEIPDVSKIDEKLEEIIKQVIEKFERFVKINKKIPAETLMSIINVDDPGRLSDLVASYLTLSAEEKQKLLETPLVYERLSLLNTYGVREIGLVEVEKNINTNVQDQIEKIQKEYYLKEKLKAIQKELGDNTAEYSEIDEYKQKISAAELPPEAEKKALKELLRLEKMQSLSAEAGIIRTYLDWLIDLPWNKTSESTLDLKKVSAVLDADHYGLEKVKDRILEYLAVFNSTRQQSGSIILLVGPPGVGKTSIAQSIAKALNREFSRISLGGLRDEAELRGHRRTYVGALPGRIIQGMARTKTRNPLIILDEIDKLSKDFKGDPSAVLMEILDPAQNKNFVDNYLELPFDLSQVLFIGTANTVFDINKPLLDRMEVIKLSGYSEDEKVEIAKSFLIPRLMQTHGLKKNELAFTSVGIHTIIEDYTREAGLRELERSLAEICRKYVRNKTENRRVYKKVSKHNLHHYLGIPKFNRDNLQLKDEVGVVKGLAWTEYGGDVLPVEVSILNGKGNLTLTGQMGEVMQESAKAALSFVRSRYSELGLKEDFYKSIDIHIHIPEGAIPKDGPSAGITMAVALASSLSGLPARGNLAMTGEITLRGRVLPVGGIKEKVLAAVRAKLDTLIIPADNKPEIADLPKKIKKSMKFLPAKSMDDVFFFALKGYQRTDEKEKKINPGIIDKISDQKDLGKNNNLTQ